MLLSAQNCDESQKFMFLMFFEFSVGHMSEIGLGTTIFGISAKNDVGGCDSHRNPLRRGPFRGISLFSSS